MAGFFDRILNREPKSAYQAKERMKLVLVHDRSNLSPQVLEQLKDEIIEVISRHVNIDAQGMRVEIAQEGREQRLIADIPIKTATKKRMG
ncbi:MAG: cell division topological specificity factor MinE [Anaerolineales bacterium]